MISGNVNLSIDGIGSFNDLYFINYGHISWGGYLFFNLPKNVFLYNMNKVGDYSAYDIIAVESVNWPNVASIDFFLNKYFSNSTDISSGDFLFLGFTNDDVSLVTGASSIPGLIDNILGFKNRTTYQVHMEITNLFELSLGGGG